METIFGRHVYMNTVIHHTCVYTCVHLHSTYTHVHDNNVETNLGTREHIDSRATNGGKRRPVPLSNIESHELRNDVYGVLYIHTYVRRSTTEDENMNATTQ